MADELKPEDQQLESVPGDMTVKKGELTKKTDSRGEPRPARPVSVGQGHGEER